MRARPASAWPNPGGEAEVVLDAGAGARLPAGRRAVEDQDAETLGRAVDRRGQPRGSGPHDDDVVHLRRVERAGEAEFLRQPLQRRVLEDVAAGADDQRTSATPTWKLSSIAWTLGSVSTSW